MTNIQIQNIDISELEKILSEIVRSEIQKNTSKETENKKSDIYGTRKEVAKELKISLPVLNEHTKKGTLKGYRIGGRVLYKWDEVFESLALIQSSKYKRGHEL